MLFPEAKFGIAKQFWQHTGLGVSSRLATRILATLVSSISPPPSPTRTKPMAHRHYSAKQHSRRPSSDGAEPLDVDQDVYLEQRYGRNLDVGAVTLAKRALRRRIAGVLVRDESVANGEVEVVQSVRGVAVTEDDVFLFPTGMTAIWSAHQLALDARGAKKSVCFGLRPYPHISSNVSAEPHFLIFFFQIPLHRHTQGPRKMGSWLPLFGRRLRLFYRRAGGNVGGRSGAKSPRTSDSGARHRVPLESALTITGSCAFTSPLRQVRFPDHYR